MATSTGVTVYTPAQIRASHILVKDEAQAKEILAKVKAEPDAFATVAKEKSTDTMSAQKGGDLGYVSADDFDRWVKPAAMIGPSA